MPEKFKELIQKYGAAAFVTYFLIFFTCLGGFYIAVVSGFDLEQIPWLSGKLGKLGNIGLAWIATKIIQIPRIALTVVLTPFVASFMSRFNKKSVTDGENGKADESSIDNT